MGALSGGITTSAYYVDGDLPKDFRDRFVEALNSRRFQDIEVESDQEESLGWVNLADPFDTDFAVEKILFNDYLMAGLRQDTLRIPGAVFKLHLRRALADYLQTTGKAKASKADEEEVRDHLEKQLRKRVLPGIKIHEFVWNIERGEVWLFTANKRVNEMFQDIFTDTFDVVLLPRNAYSRLEKMGLSDDDLEHAARLEPTVFAVPGDLRR
ncbi:MAG: hypothetical protein ACQEXJ_24735 [Myxococcota bacterium]